MNDWILTKDELPEDDQVVMCWQRGIDSGTIPVFCCYDDDDQTFIPIYSEQYMTIEVMWWMPIPDRPDEAEDE